MVVDMGMEFEKTLVRFIQRLVFEGLLWGKTSIFYTDV